MSDYDLRPTKVGARIQALQEGIVGLVQLLDSREAK